MQYRNLIRVFTFNKALKAFNKSRQIDLSLAEVMTLVSVSHLQGIRGVKLEDIRNHLCSFYRSYPLDVIQKNLRKAASFGFVDITGYYPALYSISPIGKAALVDLEERCRTTRIDK